MKKIILFILLSSVLYSCEKNVVGLDKISYDLDSTVFMYYRVNSDVFYGNSYQTYCLTPDSLDPSTIIYAFFPEDNMFVSLNNRMRLNDPKANRPAFLKIEGVLFILVQEEPFNLTLTSLTDSLIAGNFFGKFINSNNDTVDISDAYFRIYPRVKDDFFLTLKLNGTYCSTSTGVEYIQRNTLAVTATDTSFQDTLISKIWINVLSFSNYFIGEHKFEIYDKYLSTTINLWSRRSDYSETYKGFSGSVLINEIQDLEENGIAYKKISNATFNIEARNYNGKVIKINDGHFSINGF